MMKVRFSRLWSWVVVIAACLLYTVLYGVVYSYGLFFVEFQAEFGSSATITSYVGSIPVACTLIMAPLVDVFLNYFSHRVVSLVALVFFVSGLLLTTFMHGIVPMFFSYSFLVGSGLGTLNLVGVALVIRYFPSRNCHRATGLSLSGSSIGMLSYGPFMPYLIKSYGWRACMQICAAIAFVVGLPCVLTFSTPPVAPKIGSTSLEDIKYRSTQDLPQTEETKSGNGDDHVVPPETRDKILKHCHTQNMYSEGNQLDTNQLSTIRGDVAHEDDTLHGHYNYGCTRNNGNRSAVFEEEPKRNSNKACVSMHTIPEFDADQECSGKVDILNMLKGEEDRTAQKRCGLHRLPNASPEYYSFSENDEVPGKLMGVQSEGENGAEISRSAIRKILEALTYPELLMMSISVLINGIGDCFYYMNLVSYMVSVGFTEIDGAHVISIMGISSLVGKLFHSFAGELLPFPTVFLLVIVPLINVGIMVALFMVRTLVPMFVIGAIIGAVTISTTSIVTYTTPHLFFGPEKVDQAWSIFLFCNGIGYLSGSIIGQSIDRTGSYNSAIWAFIGMYLISSMLFILAPLYQRVFAKDRYVMMELYRERKNKRGTLDVLQEPHDK